MLQDRGLAYILHKFNHSSLLIRAVVLLFTSYSRDLAWPAPAEGQSARSCHSALRQAAAVNIRCLKADSTASADGKESSYARNMCPAEATLLCHGHRMELGP